ncbi:MAG: DUF480 domain-containing protein [Planctomycetota bacterium]
MPLETKEVGPDRGLSKLKGLTKAERRALGTLAEKAFTTPGSYPLTPKALLAGCNQSSNRDPVTHYSEAQVEDAANGLQERGLLAVVRTEGGRTERYRHYLRKATDLSEPQLAVITELMLRGRQTVGELRGRAGRMVPIDSLEELRSHLADLIACGFVRAGGPLERRGVEVDHALHGDDETPAAFGAAPPQAVETASGDVDDLRETVAAQSARIDTLEASVASLREDLAALRSELS